MRRLRGCAWRAQVASRSGMDGRRLLRRLPWRIPHSDLVPLRLAAQRRLGRGCGASWFLLAATAARGAMDTVGMSIQDIRDQGYAVFCVRLGAKMLCFLGKRSQKTQGFLYRFRPPLIV